MSDGFQERELRAYVDLKLKDQAFLQQLYRELRINHSNEQIQKMDADDLYRIIIKQNLLETLLRDANNTGPATGMSSKAFGATATEMADDNVPIGDVSLKVTIVEGKGFTEYLDKNDPKKKLRVAISFLKNRKMTKPVQASSQPIIDQTFLLSFGSMFEANQTTFDYLLKLRSPMSIVILEEDAETGNRKLLCEKQVEWRFVLVHKNLTMNHELMNATLAKGPLGIIKIHSQLITKGGQQIRMSEEMLDGQLESERKAQALKAVSFFEFSQTWYNEYRALKADFAKRAVKIYVEHSSAAANYESSPLKPIFTYVHRLKLRGIDSPEHAARFVSLIPFRKPQDPQNAMHTWRNFHSFLAEGSGEVQDHAALLCSLLLGFGLDAYICLGSCTDGAHCWVLTRQIERDGAVQKAVFTYWESLTGQRYNQNDPKVNYLYRRIGCIFNDRRYYANMQESDTAFKTSLMVEDQSKWKSMGDLLPYSTMLGLNNVQRLLSSPGESYEEEEALENDIKTLIKKHRDAKNYYTRFHDDLSCVLGSALNCYEINKVTGASIDSATFQQGVKNLIPDGHIFKAIPIQLNHKNPVAIFETIRSNPLGEEIINIIGDQISYAVRVKIVSYPENIFATWVMLGVHFIDI